MATLKPTMERIDAIKVTTKRGGPAHLVVDCDMCLRDMEDAIAQFSEQMGDDVFMDYVNRMME